MNNDITKKNIKGFTLVELLAVIIILGILISIAVPSIMRTLTNAKNKLYVEDAKKMITIAESKIRSGEEPRMKKGEKVSMTLEYLNSSEFKNAPNGGVYDEENSYIIIERESNGYSYFVSLVERYGKVGNYSYRGIKYTAFDRLGLNSVTNIKISELQGIDSIDGISRLNGVTIEFLIDKIKSAEQIYDDNVSSANVSNSAGIVFSSVSSSTNGRGLYRRTSNKNSGEEIYFYRGNVDNNNVLFANFCWKIVRTTSTGGIKLIYNGVPNSQGQCLNKKGANTQIGTSTFSVNTLTKIQDAGYMTGVEFQNKSKSMSGATYMYGNKVKWNGTEYELQDTITSSSWADEREELAKRYHYTCLTSSNKCSKVYYIYRFDNTSTAYYFEFSKGLDLKSAKESMFSNKNDSAIKTVVDSWYRSNMTSYTENLENTDWCNDRAFKTGSLAGESIGAKNLQNSLFGSANRNAKNSNFFPSLKCPNKNDTFTLKSSSGGSSNYGNNMLIYPVGLLTMDELILGGLTYNAGSDSYLVTGQNYWTLSPYDFSGSPYIVMVNSSGSLTSALARYNYGIRPSVSLKKKTRINGGEGTSDKPYIIS